MEKYYQTYLHWTKETENQILTWFDPDLSWHKSPTRNWFGAEFSFAFALMIAYVGFVVFGTILMHWLPPVNTKSLQFIYNPVQIVFCSYMALEAWIQGYRHGYTFFPCNPFNVEHPVMGNIIWLFYMSKILDLWDTIFIILNKKWNQLSFLHVYHHLTILAYYWLNLRFGYDGDIYFTIVTNGLIHVMMYTYYFVSQHTKNVWWKPYLTILQMIQFMMMEYQGYVLITTPNVEFPYRISLSYTIYVQSLFWLFFHFFVRSYMKKSKTTETKKIKDQ